MTSARAGTTKSSGKASRLASPAWLYGVPLVWFAVHVCLASGRSLWNDEIAWWEEVVEPFAKGMRMLVEEHSPFAPGSVLLGYLSKGLFEGFSTEEVWARVPSILWGALTVWLSTKVSAKRSSPVFTALVFFSAALSSYSTEFRPYSALLFSGALAFYLLWDREKELTTGENAVTWFTIAFTHMYGICFVGAACVLRREWGKAAASVAWVIAILWIYTSHHHGAIADWNHPPEFRDWFTMLRECLGNLANPHKASIIIAPLFAVGLHRLWRDQRRLAALTTLLLAVTIAGPVLATAIGSYVFYPRQIVAAVFPFLFVAALGFETVFRKLGLPRLAAPTAALVMGVTWTLTTVLHVPPFVNVPHHTYKKVLTDALDTGARRILIMDVIGTFGHYLPAVLGTPEHSGLRTYHGIRVLERCWSTGVCSYSYGDYDLWEGPTAKGSKGFDELLRDRELGIDYIIYGMPELKLETKLPRARTY